ncbi:MULTISPECIES: hypothetical protein [unclassified Mycobacterium]|uniref:hypothetical protein n=1 Tax=unclassified Mycobacterium TaxID=2642494 RepID=UPI0029C8DEC2|nr:MULTISPECIES: hypothetical protein [unclassified Mycobacterium]
MIKVEVKPRSDNKFDIYVSDGDNKEPLLNSNQGYENVEDAERIAYRLLASLPVWSRVVGVSPDFTEAEPIILVTTYRDGKTRTEQIR